jgi:hypothetical protein
MVSTSTATTSTTPTPTPSAAKRIATEATMYHQQ